MKTAEIITLSGLTMGGTWSMRQPAAMPDASKIVQAACDLVEAQMSAWRPDSALVRLNAAKPGDWVDLPAEMHFVLSAGLQLMAILPEAFSVLLGGAAARTGFQPGLPLGVSSDPADVECSAGRARRLADVTVDLNAIAKGFAADLAARLLRDEGYGGFVVEVAGDIRANGERPDGLPWISALELPLPDRTVPARRLPLHNCGVASSGSYRRTLGGASHLIDPLSGKHLPADQTVVAVVAPTAMEADGWATALAVLGPERGMDRARRHGLAALWITPDASSDGFVEQGSPAMASLLGLAA